MATYRAVFSGYDASGNLNLWVTNGTAAGTSELSAAGAYPAGLLNNTSDSNPDFTVLGRKVLFAGLGGTGVPNLWVTDGTSAGTSELTFFPPNELFSGLVNPDFTVLGAKAVFEGVGPWSLWRSRTMGD
jgi:ELWxxDGT repeat protein